MVGQLSVTAPYTCGNKTVPDCISARAASGRMGSAITAAHAGSGEYMQTGCRAGGALRWHLVWGPKG